MFFLSKSLKGLLLIIFSFLTLLSSVPLYSQNFGKNELLRNEYVDNVLDGFDVEWTDSEISFYFYYEGSDIPPAKMFLYDNGVLVLESQFYSEGYQDIENRFFLYRLEGERLIIKPVDERYDVSRYLEIAKYYIDRNQQGILAINPEDESVTFSFGKEINFLGISFFKMQ